MGAQIQIHIFRRGLGKMSALTFPNMNVTQIITIFLVARKMIQKWLQ